MDRDTAIKVDNVHKSFKVPHEKDNSLKSAIINIFKKKTYTVFQTAKGVSFEVKKGEFLGIIGRNGSGKSTMLKMLANIYQPDSGKIFINGRLSPFLELGVGFNPELTGRENIYLNGTILGLSRKEINEKFEEIVDFSELKDFIDQKLKNYSSGMQVRLAFSVAIHAHADILLIDEVLAVGDINFQNKCYEVFKSLKAEGKTIVFISHAMGQVAEFCDRVLVYNKGNVVTDTNASDAISCYNKLNYVKKIKKKKDDTKNEGYRVGSGKAKITESAILDVKNKKTSVFRSEDSMRIKVSYSSKPEVEKLYFAVSIYPENKPQSVIAVSKKINPRNHSVEIVISRLNLANGIYYISMGLTEALDSWESPFDLLEKHKTFVIKNDEILLDYYDFSVVSIDAEIENER